jgi:hypothetical protein
MITKHYFLLVVLSFTFITKPNAYRAGVIAGARRSLAGVTVYKVVSSHIKEMMQDQSNDRFDKDQVKKQDVLKNKDKTQSSKISQIIPHVIGVAAASIAVDKLLYWDRFRTTHCWGVVSGAQEWMKGCCHAMAAMLATLGTVYAIRREIPMTIYIAGAANAIPIPILNI